MRCTVMRMRNLLLAVLLVSAPLPRLAVAALQIPAEHLILTATHTHSVPFRNSPDLASRVVDAISQASAHLRPAQMGYGTGSAATYQAPPPATSRNRSTERPWRYGRPAPQATRTPSTFNRPTICATSGSKTMPRAASTPTH